jgi:riboflavin biosynthesis pyrimidine reductase
VTDTRAATSGLRLAEHAAPGLPYVGMNMVSTADGRGAVEGKSAPMSSPADREIFHGLRTQVDAVMVGGRTASIEGYGPMIKSPELAARREEEGLEPNPLAVLVSSSLAFDPGDVPLLGDPESRVAVVTSAANELEGTAAQMTYIRTPAGEGNLKPALALLREEHGVGSILCEGGPSLFHALLREELVTELFLSVAPLLAAGEPALDIVHGPALPEPARLWLVSCNEAEDSLFLRYRVRRDAAS